MIQYQDLPSIKYLQGTSHKSQIFSSQLELSLAADYTDLNHWGHGHGSTQNRLLIQDWFSKKTLQDSLDCRHFPTLGCAEHQIAQSYAKNA